jgi:Ca2+:H+ antiporter
MATSQPNAARKTPIWSWALPVAACLFLAGKFSGLFPADSALVLGVADLILIGAVFASVHHAEVIALRVGEPFGSIVLAISVTVIEVALIVSIMLSAKGGSDVLARDTVFATVMLVLNAIVGLCLLLGGARHREQIFQTDAAAAALSVLGTLSVITLVLPNYTLAKPGPVYEQSQLIFVSTVSVVLYGIFLFVQTVRHRHYFLNLDLNGNAADDSENHDPVPSVAKTILSLGLLCVSLGAVVQFAKVLSPPLETAIEAARLPKTLVGVVIAAVVLLPEGTTAILAARKNRLQNSLNLALGSALATIGLTIPAVSMAALLLGQPLTLGLDPKERTLLLVTLFISTVTLATGRTTILQGAVHCVLAAVFIFLTAVP